ncbi:MAG: segregation/condensation protein A [Candidatus Methanofastidiosia archaeon]
MEIGPIDMLMGLVISREIDPWNIDIVELTNKYLERIKKLQELDLRLSGKTILVASILLRMQSEELFKEKKENIPEEEEELDVEIMPILPPLRRISGKITLPQLMEALLQALEEADRKKNLKTRKRREEKQIIRIDEHRINIEKYVQKLYILIKESVEKTGIIKFFDLVPDKTPINIARTFLYVLYLETRGKIEIYQEELFGEIYIKLPVKKG